MLFLNVSLILILLQLASTQKPSPCPDVLTYEEGGPEEDRWYGRIKLSTDFALVGVWLRIELNRPVDLLGNWFAEASSDNNKNFLITNRNYQIEPNRPLLIRFFVKHKIGGPVPMVRTITLNGRIICSSIEETTTTSTTAATTTTTTAATTTTTTRAKPQNNVPNAKLIDPFNNQQSTNTRESIEDGASDDDLFSGDFSFPQLASISAKEENCGTVKVPVHPLITDGQPTVEGEWPWHAAIYRSKGITFQYVCGGSLISVNHVLTVAHCVAQLKRSTPINEDLLIIYLGKYNLYRLGQNVQNNGVKKISIHPEYNATYLYNNIAVLHLDSPVEITDFVRPVCLWEEDNSINSILEKLGTIVGWGYNRNAKISEILTQAKMPIVTNEICIFSNTQFFSLFASPTTYCAGFRNGTSACVGDSGGGMVFPKKDGQNTVWQLRGIISISAAAKTKLICDTSNYVLFTDAAKYLDWIRNVIKS